MPTGPTEQPTISPTTTTFIPTGPTSSPTISPTTTTFIPTGPTIQPTFSPTNSPSISPTSISCGGLNDIELYVYYNETNSSYWTSTPQLLQQYAQFTQQAILLTFTNLTGFNMTYGVDIYINEPWNQAGIINWVNCMIFTIKITTLPGCPRIPDPDPGEQLNSI